MTHPSRSPLDAASLVSRLAARGASWTDVRVSAETGSTNADLVALAAEGAPEGTVVTTDLQTAGRGRLDRGWEAPAQSGVFVSVLLRPDAAHVAPARWGWIPLLAGVAVAEVVAGWGVPAGLKWPNDVVVGDSKLAGILAERHDDAVVVGIGINVSLTSGELPVPTATSLLLAGSELLDREALLAALLDRLARRDAGWVAAAGDPEASGLARDYADASTSIGREVTVSLPTGETLRGRAERIDEHGRLVVDGRAVAAGDVVHVR